MTEIRQFKLTNGDELVCEVVEWPNTEEDSQDLVVRNAYKIVAYEGDPSGNRYYTFRPWMIYQHDPELFQLINGYHVVGEATPSTKVIEHYLTAVKAENDNNEELQKRVQDYMDKLKKLLEASIVPDISGDSDTGSKVIRFPSKKLH